MSRSGRGSQRAPFVAYVYENDYEEIQKLVQFYPNIETGGDLFGLWKDERTVIIQQFIGPGKECHRTTTSFHQDIEYLHKVGSLITTKEGLCNVGEWHSHHQIAMPHPSDGDRRTVFSNMPHLGLERFVLFIATIESKSYSGKKRSHQIKLDDIKLRPFLFLDSTQKMVEGEIELIPDSNPHRLNEKIKTEIEGGAEIPHDGAKRISTNRDDNHDSTSKNLEKKKKAGKEGSKFAGEKSKSKDKPQTLKQQAESVPLSQGEPPQPPSRERKPQNVHLTKSDTGDESFGEKPRDGQQQACREPDQHAERQRQEKEKEKQWRDGCNNENRSPNTGPTAPGGTGNQSPPTSPSTPQMNTPQYARTTSSPTVRQVLNASRNSSAMQGQVSGVHRNGFSSQSIPPNSATNLHFSTAAGADHSTRRQSNSVQPQFSIQPPQQTGSRNPQRNTPPADGAGYSSLQGHRQGNRPHQSHTAQPHIVGELTGEGYF